MWLSEIKRKAEPTGTLPDISVNAAGDINLETAAARICIKNSGEIVIEGAVTINGSAIRIKKKRAYRTVRSFCQF